MIYLDNAATTLRKPEPVISAVVQAMQYMGNCGRGAHEGSLGAARAIYQAREELAALLGCCRADRVCFTANSTEALNIAISGLIRPGERVITTELEHNSVLRPLYRLQREQGVGLDFVKADTQGNINYNDFARLLKPDTRAIVTTHASNLTGTVLDLDRIGAFAHTHGLVYIVDASQTAGSFPIDTQKSYISALCFTGHKGLMGPQGTGGLCVGEGVEIRPWKVGGTGVQSYSQTQPESYPTRLEAGTLNGHGIAGLSAAVAYIREITPQAIHAREMLLTHRFLEGVRGIDGVTVYGDYSVDTAPIVALNIRDYSSATVADELSQAYGIAVRAGAHCAPLLHKALGTTEQGAVRFSFGWFNTPEDTEAAIEAVRRIAE